MDRRINLAGLPKVEALARAHVGGRAIFGDDNAISAVYPDLKVYWLSENAPEPAGQSEEEFRTLSDELAEEFRAGVDEAIKEAQAESLSIPNPFEGEASAERAALIVRALQWLHNNTFVDTSPEDIEDYRTLVEVSLEAIGKELETVQRALTACRSERETS